jgi:hypothetical protein
MAQVYSVNAVGYVKKTLVAGFNLISNPLDVDPAAADTVGTVFGTTLPNQSKVYIWTGSWQIATFVGAPLNQWTGTGATASIDPGIGFWVSIPAGTADLEVTFVGEVVQGDLVNPIGLGFTLSASQVPQEAGISSVLGFPAANQDKLYFWRNGGWDIRTYVGALSTWTPGGEPSPAVGESFWVSTAAAKDWTRTFSVNQ